MSKYAKQIKQEREWYEEGLKIAKIKEYSPVGWKLFAMGYVDSKKRIKDYKEKN